VERTCFSTPYLHGALRVDACRPASIEVSRDHEPALIARMSAAAPGRGPSRCEDRNWTGPVFLPNKRGKGDGPVRYFPAALSGAAYAYPYLPSEDLLEIRPSREDTALRSLVESGFHGQEWVLVEDGTHAKGRTVEAGSAAAVFARSEG
jgi:hypothetical protein